MVKSSLEKDEWKGRKYDISDNLFYFLDGRRVLQCDLVARIDERSNISIDKDHQDLRKELF